jgi:hypothetical protein
MSSIWKSLGIGGNKSEEAEKLAIEAQLKYIYSAYGPLLWLEFILKIYKTTLLAIGTG